MWNYIGAIRDLFVANRAFPILLDNLTLQSFRISAGDLSSRYPLAKLG